MLFRVGCRLEFGVLLGTQGEEEKPSYRQGLRKYQVRYVYLRRGGCNLAVRDDYYTSCMCL